MLSVHFDIGNVVFEDGGDVHLAQKSTLCSSVWQSVQQSDCGHKAAMVDHWQVVVGRADLREGSFGENTADKG